MATDSVARGLAISAIAAGGSGGTSNYNELSNKPKINSVELSGNKPLSEFNIQEKLTAGDNISIDSDNVISATDTTYTAGSGISITNNVISVNIPQAQGQQF